MILKKFEPTTGKSRHLLEVSKRLAERGDSVVLITNEVKWKGDPAVLAHLTIHVIGGSQNSLYLREREVLQMLEDEHVDVIELHGGLVMSLFAKRFARHAHVPLVLNLHSQPTDLVREIRHLRRSDPWFDRSYIMATDDWVGLIMKAVGYRWFWTHPAIRAVIVPSRKLCEQYADVPNIHWIPSGADMEKYAPSQARRDEARAQLGYRDKDRVVLFFSRAVMVRGMDTLIRACEKLASEIPDVRLVFFVLPDVDVERLKRMITSSPIASQITLNIGRNPQMPTALQAADVCAFPFRTTGCIPEQPLTVLEAMASEKAVVTTTIGSLPEIITHGEDGMLVPPNNPDALAIALQEVLNNSELRKKLEIGAREKIAREYNWDTITSTTRNVYEQAIR